MKESVAFCSSTASVVTYLNIFSLGKRDIRALGVMCANASVGCHWEGIVGTFDEHMATCKLSLVPCPKECQDDSNEVKRFMRKDLPQHLQRSCPNRDYECEHCGKRGTYTDITQVHDEVCEKKVLPCPNAECTLTVQRRGIKRHLDSCDHTQIPCKYRKLGCDVTMKRSAVSHEDEDKLHLHMALDKIAIMEENMGKIFLTEEEELTFELTGYQNKKDMDEEFTSSFYTSPKGYHMVLNVYAYGCGDGAGTHVSVYARILKGKYDDVLEWPFEGSITCTLLNQLRDGNHLTMKIRFTDEDNGLVGSGWGFAKSFAHSTLDYDYYFSTQYLKDDTLYFRVSAKVKNHKPWLNTGVHKVP